MRIETELKLNFRDVLIKPKRSTLTSRKEVSLHKSYITKHSKQEITGIPVVASNMDTTGTFQMAIEFEKHGTFVILHKFYSVDDIVEFFNDNPKCRNNTFISSGITDKDIEKLDEIIQCTGVDKICLDVANGYTEFFVERVKRVRRVYPDAIIMAGNVCSGEMTEELVLAGADIIKIGIGNGCFAEDTRILMANGSYKNISKIQEGEFVINKNGNPVKVNKVFSTGIKNTIQIKNSNWYENTYVTPDHLFWVGDCSNCSNDTISNSGFKKILDRQDKRCPKQSKYKWKPVGEISESQIVTLLPKNINWKLPECIKIDMADFCIKYDITDTKIINQVNKIENNRYLYSSYDLGYIFGTYLGDGSSSVNINDGKESAACSWAFGYNEMHVAIKLSNCIKNVFDYDCKIIQENSTTKVFVYNKAFSKMLFTFDKRTDKQLPINFRCSNKDYIKGIYDGLVDSDGCYEENRVSFANTSINIIELFSWCCMSLGISFSQFKQKKSTGLVNCNLENCNQVYITKTHSVYRETQDYTYSRLQSKENHKELEVWDIEVECPTHSFIANNTIVHNSFCLTRNKTGVGIPQLSAIIECADAAHGLGGLVLSDGGHSEVCDVSKAFGAGADFVMLGGMFAGHTESGGNIIEKDGKQYKEFYGMSSETAMNKYHGGMNKYRSSEGDYNIIPFKGNVEKTILDILGGLRSTCTYVGAKNLKELPKRTTFVRVNNIK